MDSNESYQRSGEIIIKKDVDRVFPLLCPKKEEEWIPGWECEVIFSESGYNEEGAIFKTIKAYGTELIWHTNAYDKDAGLVDFLITANGLFLFRFIIRVTKKNGLLILNFDQTFTSISEKGKQFIREYESDNFQSRVDKLKKLMDDYLARP